MSMIETWSGRSPSTRARHQMGDCRRLLGIHRRPGAQLHHHAALGGLFVFQKYGVFGEGDVDTGLLNGLDRAQTALQLPLDGALVVDVLGEIGGAEIGLVEDLETDASGLGQALGGEAKALLGHLRGRHQNARARLVEAHRNSRFL
ncbi:MAG: hypothetical protein U5J83_13010 [Bryobacterales bacterium]|nr:hypothetical protein [Bryobacterales bacterium]